MIALGNATTTLTASLGGAVSSTQPVCTVFYEDEPAVPTAVAIPIHDKQLTTFSSATTVTILAAGAGGSYPISRRRVKSILIRNLDTAAVTITISIADTAGSTNELVVITLQTGEQLIYEEGFGFYALDVNGAEKSQAAATSSATSTADSKAVSAATAGSTTLSTVTAQSTTTSSAVTSAAGAASVADSKAVSDSVVISANLSTATAQSTTTSSTASIATANQSLGSSAGWSTSISKVKSSFSF